MPKTGLLLKVALYMGTVIAFVFSFLAYTVAVRPQIQSKTNDYTLGLIEGGIIVFVFTALPLTYAYLVEKEKKKRVSRKK